MVRFAQSAVFFCACWLVTMPVASQVCAIWEATAQWGPLPGSEAPANSSIDRWRELLRNSSGSRASTLMTHVSGADQLFGFAHQTHSRQPCAAVVSNRPWLLDFRSRPGAPVKPFPVNPPAISNQYKVLDSEGRLLMISIGWIPRTIPSQYVVQDGQTIVLRFPVRDLAEGRITPHPWTEYGVLGLDMQSSPTINVSSLITALASPEASAFLGEYFWVVPNNDRLRRRLRIEFVDDNRNVVAQTPCSPSDCYPTPSDHTSLSVPAGGQGYVVCGSASRSAGAGFGSACPQINSAVPNAASGGRTTRVPAR